MKIDVTQLPYSAVLDVVSRTRWIVRELQCDNGRGVLDCAPA